MSASKSAKSKSGVPALTPPDSNAPWHLQWSGVIQIAGALTGLASLVYLIGASTVWLRARLVGLPADIAIEHESQSGMVAIGLRGILYLGLGYGIFVAAGTGTWYLSYVLCKQQLPKDFRKEIGKTAEWLTPKGTLIGLIDAVVIGIASLISWRVFAATIGAAGAFGGTIRWVDNTKPEKLIGTLGLALAAFIAGLGWQITSHIEVSSVYLKPRLPTINRTMPYFGATDSYFYVGMLAHTPQGYHYTYQIAELPRAKYQLTFNGKSFTFCRSNQAPVETVLRIFAGSDIAPHRGQCGA